jgi:hypothetical protein
MTLRRAAPLALVGWYLMVPPLHDEKPDTQAPISAWAVFSQVRQRRSLPGVEVEA